MVKPWKYICPSCKQKAGVNVKYGYPGSEMSEAAERGEIVLGGCCLPLDGDNSPERACTSCGHEWRIKRRPIRFPDGTLVPPELLNRE